MDILTSLDRIGSHCSNIGLHIAKKLATDSFDEMHGHIYTNGYKTSEEYKALYCYYMSLYSDPITEKYKASLSELEHKISQSDANKSSAPKSSDPKTDKTDKNEQQTKKEPKLKEIKKAKIEKVKQKKDSKKK